MKSLLIRFRAILPLISYYEFPINFNSVNAEVIELLKSFSSEVWGQYESFIYKSCKMYIYPYGNSKRKKNEKIDHLVT